MVGEHIDMHGAVDMHVHFGPDPHRERSVTAAEAVADAALAGHAGIVLKSHESSTAHLAGALDRAHGVRVFGGITCDITVGGMNAHAVEAALRTGAKVVWLPTGSSAQDWERYGREAGVPWPGVRVCDDDARLLPESHEVMALVAEHSAVLATGHVSIAEHLAVARALPRGAHLVVTHALIDICGPGPEMTVEILEDLAALGAVIELCALTCIGGYATKSAAELAAAIRRLGAEHCTLATDFGQAGNPRPAEGLARFAAALAAEGIGAAEIRRMSCDNPSALLGMA